MKTTVISGINENRRIIKKRNKPSFLNKFPSLIQKKFVVGPAEKEDDKIESVKDALVEASSSSAIGGAMKNDEEDSSSEGVELEKKFVVGHDDDPVGDTPSVSLVTMLKKFVVGHDDDPITTDRPPSTLMSKKKFVVGHDDDPVVNPSNSNDDLIKPSTLRTSAITSSIPENYDFHTANDFSRVISQRGINQGDCGSCFAIASTFAIQSRFHEFIY